jgi:hypothetical protein
MEESGKCRSGDYSVILQIKEGGARVGVPECRAIFQAMAGENSCEDHVNVAVGF